MVFSDTIIDTAYKWLCKRRKDYHHNSDVWHLRFYWKTEKQKLIKALKEETFSFDCVEKNRTPYRTSYLWSARDALVLKALSIYLEDKLKPILSDRSFHLAGNKNTKKESQAAIREVYNALPEHHFVFRTDVKGYYASINHDILFEQIKRYIKEPFFSV